jgi:hypothetical protein
MTGRFLIWSIEHEAWWGPGRSGYTRDVRAAGDYSRGEAWAIVEDANIAAFHECAIPVECVMVPPVVVPEEEA